MNELTPSTTPELCAACEDAQTEHKCQFCELEFCDSRDCWKGDRYGMELCVGCFDVEYGS